MNPRWMLGYGGAAPRVFGMQFDAGLGGRLFLEGCSPLRLLIIACTAFETPSVGTPRFSQQVDLDFSHPVRLTGSIRVFSVTQLALDEDLHAGLQLLLGTLGELSPKHETMPLGMLRPCTRCVAKALVGSKPAACYGYSGSQVSKFGIGAQSTEQRYAVKHGTKIVRVPLLEVLYLLRVGKARR